MRSGFMPGQQAALRRAFKKAEAFDHFRQRTRRGFLSVGAAGIAGSIGAFWVGTWTSRHDSDVQRAHSPEPGHPQLAVAHRLALGPDADLRANAAMFLVVLDAIGGDELTWAGFGRLVRMACEASPPDRRLARRLRASADRPHRPTWLNDSVRELEALTR